MKKSTDLIRYHEEMKNTLKLVNQKYNKVVARKNKYKTKVENASIGVRQRSKLKSEM